MRIYHRTNGAPNFYFEFRPEPRTGADEQTLNAEGVPLPAGQAGHIKRITRNGNTIGYEIDDASEANQGFIRNNIVAWITEHANWYGYEKNDLEAIKLLKEWCTWLVAIETAVIAALAAFAKDIVLWWEPGYDFARGLAAATIVALGFSIFWAIHLLLALPAISQRLPPKDPNNDIYSMDNNVTHRRVSVYVDRIRWSSLAGFAFFMILVLGIVIFEKFETHLPHSPS